MSSGRVVGQGSRIKRGTLSALPQAWIEYVAFQFWLSEGRPNDRNWEHWFRAEAELWERLRLLGIEEDDFPDLNQLLTFNARDAIQVIDRKVSRLTPSPPLRLVSDGGTGETDVGSGSSGRRVVSNDTQFHQQIITETVTGPVPNLPQDPVSLLSEDDRARCTGLHAAIVISGPRKGALMHCHPELMVLLDSIPQIEGVGKGDIWVGYVG